MVTGQGDSIVAQPSAELFSVGNRRLLKVEQRADRGPLLPQRPKVKILGAQQTREYGLAEDHWLRSPQLGETGIGQYKAAIGSRLRACTLSGQQGETAIAVEVQGHMIRIAKLIPVRTA